MTSYAYQDDPVVIVGYSFRLPRAAEDDTFWETMLAGRTAFTDQGRGVRRSAKIDSYAWDAAAFGLGEDEAAATDPQQLLAMELAVHAVEDAGVGFGTLRSATTCVTLGAMACDFRDSEAQFDPTPYSLTGTSTSFIANRVSQTLGLSGTSVVIDTGQSSSLMAVHEAAIKVRSGECDYALAGGVQLNGSALSTSMVDAAGVLSVSGEPRLFSTRSDGYLRGEGGALVLLCRRSTAVEHGLVEHAAIAGSATNCGRQGRRLTAPDSRAQQAVVESALQRAGLSPNDLDYLELHGTGTRVGDASEAAAMIATFAERNRPLPVGSAKQTIGHLESAAGAASLIKALHILEHGVAPGAIVDQPLAVLAEQDSLVLDKAPRVLVGAESGLRHVGLSSFGLGGTNCHLILASPTPRPEIPTTAARSDDSPTRIGLCSASPEHARAQAATIAQLIDDCPEQVAIRDIAATAHTRDFGDFRTTVLAATADELAEELRAVAGGTKTARSTIQGESVAGLTACVFPGQGSQRKGMGASLIDRDAEFAWKFEEICAALNVHLDEPIQSVMWGTEDDSIHDTRYTQPALFAFEASLFHSLCGRGFRPDILIGHSIGEITALYCAGYLSLADAAEVVTSRAAAMADLPRTGGMLAVRTGATALAPAIENLSASVRFAALNSPEATVVAGTDEALQHVSDWCERNRLKSQRLQVSHAFHSPLIDPVGDRMIELQNRLRLRAPHTRVISTSTGAELAPMAALPDRFLMTNASGTVHFHDAVQVAIAAGTTKFVEVGPGRALSTFVAQTAPVRSHAMSPKSPSEASAIDETAATLFTWGADPSILDRQPHTAPAPFPLPKTVFLRQPSAPVPASTENRSEADESGLLSTVVDALARLIPGAGPIDTHRSFSDLGLDSRGAVQLAETLTTTVGTRIADTVVYRHSTPALLADFLGGQSGVSDRASVGPRIRRRRRHSERIAIVAASCKLPGGIETPADLWATVQRQRCVIGDFPTDRGWNVTQLFDPTPGTPCKTYVRSGGFLESAGSFDPQFFDLSNREATAMDPQQRATLELSQRLVEASRGSLPTRTGVYVGATSNDYGARLYESGIPEHQGHRLTGTTPSVISGRVAYHHGLTGPALSVDTACSSSLVALHTAADALRGGDCDAAIAGGVTVMATPGMFVEFSAQHGLAPDGRCKPFADNADGTAWAEGAVYFLLELESVAKARGRKVLGYISGSAVTQDGKSNGLTAPNGRSQEEAIGAALGAARVDPRDVDLVEAHGTGTRLGDPIEATAVANTYGQHRDPHRPLHLGSVKSNLGHTQAAAGAAGLLKVLLAMRHSTIPKTLFADTPTTMIDWRASNITLPQRNTAWERHRTRRIGAVSAFGISGTNCHMIVEED
ncbi:type I polyketide synthase [Antrihabitans cavernicola]|nr:type I polyketide synthase [Spelaeibacter cavernicola]